MTLSSATRGYITSIAMMKTETSKIQFLRVWCLIAIFGCTQQYVKTPLLPPSSCDPFFQFFWGKNVKYFVSNKIGDTTFLDREGNIVREVLAGRLFSQFEYSQSHSLIREWREYDNRIDNKLYDYVLVDSTAVVQKCVFLTTKSWKYEPKDVCQGGYSFKIYTLDNVGRVKREESTLNNDVVFYSYEGTYLIGEEHLTCGQFGPRFEYAYKDGQLIKMSTYFDNAQTPGQIDFFQSGLLDSTINVHEDGSHQTTVYRYVYY